MTKPRRSARSTRPADLAAQNANLAAAVVSLQAEVRRLAASVEPSRKSKVEPDPKWSRTQKECPHCHDTKVVIPDFGIRTVRGVQRSQPWCKQCRATTNYHARPRKNRTASNPF